MDRKHQLVVWLFVLSMVFGGGFSVTWATDLRSILTHNVNYDATQAANNKAALITAIQSGEPLTCETGGEFWFDGPLPLPPAYRVKNTAYAIGDRVLADGDNIYVCTKAGTSDNSHAIPAGEADAQDEGGGSDVRWDFVEEASSWDRNGLTIRGPTSQHAPQAVEEYNFAQDRNLRFNVRLNANTDAWAKLDDDTPPAWRRALPTSSAIESSPTSTAFTSATPPARAGPCPPRPAWVAISPMVRPGGITSAR